MRSAREMKRSSNSDGRTKYHCILSWRHSEHKENFSLVHRYSVFSVPLCERIRKLAKRLDRLVVVGRLAQIGLSEEAGRPRIPSPISGSIPTLRISIDGSSMSCSICWGPLLPWMTTLTTAGQTASGVPGFHYADASEDAVATAGHRTAPCLGQTLFLYQCCTYVGVDQCVSVYIAVAAVALTVYRYGCPDLIPNQTTVFVHI